MWHAKAGCIYSMKENVKMPTVIICRCAYAELIPEEKLSAAVDAATNAGCGAVVVPDLCELAAKGKDALPDLADGELVILACKPRTVRWLLHRAGIDGEADALRTVDLREADVAEIASALPKGTGSSVRPVGDIGEWQPWFPVIDYDRCGNCKQCLNFCLFGVYELDGSGTVSVTHPENCKNRCPACARVCPDVAIIFPKLPASEAPLDGSEVSDEAAQTARIKVDLEEILGDDVYAALEGRKKERQRRLLKRRSMEQADRERKACSRECDAGDCPRRET